MLSLSLCLSLLHSLIACSISVHTPFSSFHTFCLLHRQHPVFKSTMICSFYTHLPFYTFLLLSFLFSFFFFLLFRPSFFFFSFFFVNFLSLFAIPNIHPPSVVSFFCLSSAYCFQPYSLYLSPSLSSSLSLCFLFFSLPLFVPPSLCLSFLSSNSLFLIFSSLCNHSLNSLSFLSLYFTFQVLSFLTLSSFFKTLFIFL